VTATQQTLALFVGVAVVLVIASIVSYVLNRRFAGDVPNPTLDNLNSRIKAWWWMVSIGFAS
jgi:phosphatidate cytidylyltransferase